jgi:hypothetical protein
MKRTKSKLDLKKLQKEFDELMEGIDIAEIIAGTMYD